MTRSCGFPWICVGVSFFMLWCSGCGGSDGDNAADTGTKSADQTVAQRNGEANPQNHSASAADKKPRFQPITLGPSAPSPEPIQKKLTEKGMDDVVEAMQPLQVLLGSWQGITRKAYSGFKAVDELNWVWDFQSDKMQPALVMTSDKSPYFRSGRMTYLLNEQKYEFKTKDKDGNRRVFVGTFSVEPVDVPGDDKKLQRTYKLQLTQVSPEATKVAWQVVFNQQENNRYLMELKQSKRAGSFNLFDTVGTQRQGTSFAISDTDFKEKTCIISQGLGTIQVSYKGKTFWVCCTGCKAAFEEEPERWIARLAEQKK